MKRRIQQEKMRWIKQIGRQGLAITIVLCLVLGNVSIAAEMQTEPSADVGQEEKNAKTIDTLEALLQVEDHQEYILNADLTIPDDMQQETALLGSKKGVILRGEGYTISNLKKPLFQELQDSTIENLYLQSMVEDTTSTGALSNTITDTEITGCGIHIILKNTEADQVGAFAGNAVRTLISNSFSTGTIEGKRSASGLVGIHDGKIQNSYSTAELTGSERVYGIAGGNTAEILDCYFAGAAIAKQVPETIYKAGDVLPGGQWQEQEGSYPQLEAKYTDVQKVKAKEINTESVTIRETKAEVPQEPSGQSAPEEVQAELDTLSLQTDKIIAGNSDTQTTTTISIGAAAGAFYKAVSAGEAAPTLSSTEFAVAKKEGWTQKSGTDGTLTISGFEWNTSYAVYKCEAPGTGTKLETIQTNKGTLAGTITTSGTALTGETQKSEITGAQTEKGEWYYEQTSSLQSAVWTTIADQNTDSLQLTQELSGQYIRVGYKAKDDSGYQGSIVGEAFYVRTMLTGVTISGTALNAEILTANVEPQGSQLKVDYAWYQEGKPDQIGGGKTYQLKASDIGEKIYVKVSGKLSGPYTGEVVSEVTDTVITKKYDAPGMLIQGTTDESSMNVSVENAMGTFEIQYKEEGGSFGDNKTLVTNNGTIIVVGLKANTTYIFRARRIASNGFLDSDWSEMNAGFRTTAAIVKGNITISGQALYGEKLTVTAEEKNGTGRFIWYRGNEIILEETAAGYTSQYTLTKKDIGKQLRIEYQGTGDYAGKLFQYTETIKKAAMALPEDLSVSVTNVTDTSADITLPANTEGRAYQVGYGISQATPLSIVSGIYDGGNLVTINGLPRNVTQYLFVRYAENESFQESEWVKASESFTTKKTMVTKLPTFKSTPQRGERLEISLKDGNHPAGTFTLKQSKDGEEEVIDNFFPVEDAENTIYYDVPRDAELNTVYTVTFTAKGDFEGSTESTSAGVIEASGVTQYEKPNAPQLVKATDTTFTVQMQKGTVGDYQFKYVDKDGNETIISKSYKAEGQLTIDKLNRVSTYKVYVKRLSGSAAHTDSEYSDALEIKTAKTPITGYVSIDEQYPRSGNKVTATYHNALYIPSGDDTEGSSWKWYRVDPATDEETEIAGAKNSEYAVANADIGYRLKAVFQSNETFFTGSKSIYTMEVQGAKLADTVVPKIEASTILYADQIAVKISLSGRSDTWYQVREANEDAPKAPKNGDDAATQKWTKFSTDTLSVAVKYDGSKLKASTKYVLYTVNAANEKESSNVTRSNEAVSGLFMQSGTVTMTGKAHVGEVLTATLTNTNNGKGQWKWYYSDNTVDLYTTKGSAPTFNNNNWEEVKDGYDKTANQKISALTIPDEAKGHFIKAVFTGSENDGYKGSVEYSTVTAKPTGSYEQYVTKTYTEKLTVSGKPYEGHNIKVTLEDSDRNFTSGAGSSSRKGVQVDTKDGSSYKSFETQVNTTANSFEITVAGTGKTHDGGIIRGWIATPNRKIYRQANGNDLGSDWMYSDTYEQRFVYSDGRINNATDMANFIKGSSPYTDRTKNYVITDNIDMSGQAQMTPSATTFSGTLNGDFHNIKGLRNPVFNKVIGSSNTNRAVVKNLIISNVTISAGRTAILVADSAEKANFEKILLYDANVTSSNDAAMLIAWANASTGGVTLESIGTAHGTFTQTIDGKSAGGMVAFFNSSQNVARNLFSVNSTMNTRTGAAAGGLFRRMDDAIVQNSYAANQIIYPSTTTGIGGIAALPTAENMGAGIKNNFYDKTILKQDPNVTHPAKGGAVDGKFTNEMIGTGLKSKLDDGSAGVWVYKDGFYPRLKWTVDHGIEAANLYAATKGAFISLDGKTTQTNMFNGQIYGVIQIPNDFQKSGYKTISSSSSVLKVSSSGVITPVKSGTATITITYTDSFGAKAVATFDFTSNVSMNAFDDVKINGTQEVGQTLTASVTPASAASGVSYTWLRRKTGTEGSGTAITGANAATYKLTPSDAGYEVRVTISKNGYGTIASGWTTAIIVGKPTSAPTISDITDNSAVFTGNGSAMTTYEFAYAKSATGEKTIVPTKGNSITATGLGRNTTYYVFARIPAGSGYAASEWSPAGSFATLKTEISGVYTVSDERMVGETIKFTFSNANAQTLRWELRRIDSETSFAQLTNFTNIDNNTITYTLTAAEVGKVIFPQVFGTGDFYDNGNMKLFDNRPVIVKAKATTPSGAPAIIGGSETDSSVKVKYTTSSNSAFEFGYAPYGSDNIQLVSNTHTANAEVVIDGLNRNTRYRFFVREASSAGYTASDWSNSSEATTKPTELAGTMNVEGTERVDETLTFFVPETNDQIGRWVLERRDDTDTLIATLTDYSVDTSGRKITYTAAPEDAGYKLKASLVGEGNFTGAIVGETGIVAKAKYEAPGADAFNITKVDDTNMEVTLANLDGNYIVKYTESGTSDEKETSEVKGNTSVTIGGLKRNTQYDLAIKRSGGAGVIGYEDSDYTAPIQHRTNKTSINGKVTLAGDAKLAETLTARYVSGSYNPAADDTQGTWKWYRGTQEIPGANQGTYTIEPADKGYYLMAEYTMTEDNPDLTGSRQAISEKIYKEAYPVPTGSIIVEADAADAAEGSGVVIRNSVSSLVYKAVLAEESAPEIPARGMELEKGWMKGTGSDISISGLLPNRAYIVYAFTPEDENYAASPMIASKRVITVREKIADVPVISGKIALLQDITAQISVYGKAPTGTFRWSVADTKDAEAWETLDVGTDSSTDTSSGSLVQIPLKYFGKFLKVTFTGSGDYEGTVSAVSDTPLLGKPLGGQVTVESNEIHVFEPVKATYDGTDETSGSWKWFSGTREIDLSAYDNFGPESTYTPTAEDIGKRLKAVYTAENPIYAGTREMETPIVAKAAQHTPDAPVIVQVKQNKVEVSPPTNYRTEAAAPEVEYGYKKAISGDIIVWQQQPSSTLTLPKPKQQYEIYARYASTSVYTASDPSTGIVATTGLLALEKDRLLLDYEKSGVAATSVGEMVEGIYTGAGYGDGIWNVYNAAGQVIYTEEGNVDDTEGTNTYPYVFAAEDLGGYVTLEFAAKSETDYEGSVQKRTKQIINKETPSYEAILPNCALEKKSNIRVDIQPGQEYLLSRSQIEPGRADAGWETYTEDTYLYEGLYANTEYYVWTRIAETETHAMSDPVKAVIRTEGGIDFGSLVVGNRDDGQVPYVSKDVALPNEIKKAAHLKVTGQGATLINQGAALTLTGTGEFVNADGTANANVYEQGSDWGNQNFAYKLEFLDGSGAVIEEFVGADIQIPANAETLRYTLYRANAVTRGGTYQFRLDMDAVNTDNTVVPVSVEASLTMETTLKAAVPLSMDLLVQDQTVTSRIRPATVDNGNDMPLLIELDEHVTKGNGMPELQGKLTKSPADVTGENEMYVKAATDGSNVLSAAGIWFTTTGASTYQPFMQIGAQGKGYYKMQGCYSQQTIFPFIDNADIQEAYQFTYRYGISTTRMDYKTSDTTAP